tara:strand:- start:585 stop:848 length:264 start_codon:yes stop_codon:yes gene_type:complete
MIDCLKILLEKGTVDPEIVGNARRIPSIVKGVRVWIDRDGTGKYYPVFYDGLHIGTLYPSFYSPRTSTNKTPDIRKINERFQDLYDR